MPRKIMLTKHMDRKLDLLASFTQEVNGIILYRKQEEHCPLERIFITGVGTEEHVQSSPERIAIANEFFRINPDYKMVKFHTHSKGTILKCGEYYQDHFSDRDIEGIKEQLKHNREFIAMLVTPTTKILSGIDNPQLVIVDDFQGYHQRSKALQQSLNIIARNRGYAIGSDLFQRNN